MPTHETHRKICTALGYREGLCNCVDEVVDSYQHDVGRRPYVVPLFTAVGIDGVGFSPWTSMMDLLEKCGGRREFLAEVAFLHHLLDYLCWRYRNLHVDPDAPAEDVVEESALRLIERIDELECRFGGGYCSKAGLSPRHLDVWRRLTDAAENAVGITDEEYREYVARYGVPPAAEHVQRAMTGYRSDEGETPRIDLRAVPDSPAAAWERMRRIILHRAGWIAQMVMEDKLCGGRKALPRGLTPRDVARYIWGCLSDEAKAEAAWRLHVPNTRGPNAVVFAKVASVFRRYGMEVLPPEIKLEGKIDCRDLESALRSLEQILREARDRSKGRDGEGGGGGDPPPPAMSSRPTFSGLDTETVGELRRKARDWAVEIFEAYLRYKSLELGILEVRRVSTPEGLALRLKAKADKLPQLPERLPLDAWGVMEQYRSINSGLFRYMEFAHIDIPLYGDWFSRLVEAMTALAIAWQSRGFPAERIVDVLKVRPEIAAILVLTRDPLAKAELVDEELQAYFRQRQD